MPPFAYEMHEMAHLAWAPARAVSDVARTWLEHPGNPLSYTAAIPPPAGIWLLLRALSFAQSD
jgi:poly-beta-hydroxyalkanoate depolymerase